MDRNEGFAAFGSARGDKKVSLKRSGDTAKPKEEEAQARKIAGARKVEKAKKAREEGELAAAGKKAREEAAAAREKERETLREAKLAGERKAEELRAERAATHEVAAAATRRGGGGFFSKLAVRTSSKQYRSEGHDIYVNQELLTALDPSNAKVEIYLGEQRARVYRSEGGVEQLVIDTAVSTGKSGHTTSTGTFRVNEMLVSKQSSLYGTWVNASGETVPSNGSVQSRPPGAARFVGAEMPYWLRINGGIGLHIGHVPGYPASHGCIRVPSSIQPLIYSKVGLGTLVTVVY